MEKLDKVIAGISGCIVGNCSNCEYYGLRCERDKLLEDALELIRELEQKYRAAVEMAAIATEKMAQGVVRCKGCVYWEDAAVNKKGFLICPASGMEITETDFCSYGERRTDG